MANKGQVQQTAPTGGASWRSLAVAVKPAEPEPIGNDALMGGKEVGHNLVIDRSVPGALSLHIATDEQAFQEMFQAKASKEKLAADPKALGARYLSKTNGPFYGSVPIEIKGQRFYLKMTLEAAKKPK